MNKELTENIIKHILTNFGIFSENYKSLMTNEFLLSEKLIFETDIGPKINTHKSNIWGCQFNIIGKELKVLLGDCSDGEHEYCLLIKLSDNPAYGLYYSDNNDIEQIIACTIDNKIWIKCNIYLQATFLAAMEQFKDIGINYEKITNYKDIYDLMISFIDYQSSNSSNSSDE